jgi:hypothetical protein
LLFNQPLAVPATEKTVSDPKTYTEEEYNALLEEKEALRAAKEQVLTEAKKAKKALENYNGVDPEKYRELLAASEEAERKKATAEGDFKALEKQLVERHQSELGERDKKVSKLQSALEKRAIRAELQAALVKAKAYPEEMDLLVERGARFARMKETDDDYVAYIADKDGNPLVADGKGTPMDFNTFVETTLKSQYPRLFEGTGSSGGGAPRSNAGGGGVKTIAAGDNDAMLANIDGILDGSVKVI